MGEGLSSLIPAQASSLSLSLSLSLTHISTEKRLRRYFSLFTETVITNALSGNCTTAADNVENEATQSSDFV